MIHLSIHLVQSNYHGLFMANKLKIKNIGQELLILALMHLQNAVKKDPTFLKNNLLLLLIQIQKIFLEQKLFNVVIVVVKAHIKNIKSMETHIKI